MASRLLFLGWNRAVVGREKQAVQLFQKAAKTFTKWQNEGQISSHETVILSSHGGDLNGFLIIKGEAGKLANLRENSLFVDIVTEAMFCLEGFGVIRGHTGEGLAYMFARYSKLIGL